MNCPICGADAKNETPGEFDGLVVDCKHCGEYGIEDAAVNAFLRLPFDARVAVLQKAKERAARDTRPLIDQSSL